MSARSMGPRLRPRSAPDARLAGLVGDDPVRCIAYLTALPAKDAARQFLLYSETQDQAPVDILQRIGEFSGPSWLHPFATALLRNPVRSTQTPVIISILFAMVELSRLVADCEAAASHYPGGRLPDHVAYELCPIFHHALAKRNMPALRTLASSSMLGKLLSRYFLRAQLDRSEISREDLEALLDAGVPGSMLATRTLSLACTHNGHLGPLYAAAKIATLRRFLIEEWQRGYSRCDTSTRRADIEALLAAPA